MTRMTKASNLKPSIMEALDEGAKEHIAADVLTPEEHTPGSDAHNMTFGQALICIKRGQRVARAGWGNRKHLSRRVIDGMEVLLDDTGYASSMWAPSYRDILAEDWRVVG